MQSEERQKWIQDYLLAAEFASLEELSKKVNASVSTVRRDISILEGQGQVRRTHGGARLVNSKSEEHSTSTRETPQLAEKEAIGRACAEIIQPNQTVIVDAGTTCLYVARHLEAKSPHIITNSLPVAHHFSASQKLEVVVSGGVIYPRLGVLVGPIAVAAFDQVHADVAIMSCGGLSSQGVSNSHGLLIEIQRAMMRAARRVILCVDHTKFGRQSISQLCHLNEIDVLVSDEIPPGDMMETLEAADVELIIASPTGSETIARRTPAAREPKTAILGVAAFASGPDGDLAFADQERFID